MPARGGMGAQGRPVTCLRAAGRAAEAAVLMGAAAAAQRWIPMTRWASFLGVAGPVDQRWIGNNHRGIPQIAATVTESQVAVAVRRAERIVPGSPTCLAQATAGQVMLRRRDEPGTVMIGLRRTEDSADGAWEAHAWLLGRSGALTGGPASAGFTATTSFRPTPGPQLGRRQSDPLHPRPGPFLAWGSAAVVRMELGLLEALPDPLTPDTPKPTVVGVCNAAAFHRVEQVLAPHSAALGFSEQASGLLQSMARESQLAGLAAATDTVRVSAALQRAAVAHLIVKGVALAVQTTGSPAGRGPGDIDVLVRPVDIPAAVAALQEAGLTLETSVAPVPGSELFPVALRVRKEALLWIGQRPVDLHWRLDDAPACLSWEFDELMSAAEWLPVGGLQLPTLSRKHAAVFNASHAARDAGWDRLRHIVDQARIMQGLDRDALREEAWRVGGGRRMELAFAMVDLLTGERHPGTPPATRALAERLWRRSLNSHEPYGRRGPSATLTSFGTGVSTQDSWRGVRQRTATALWPSAEMARRSLGAVGDRHPWVYLASSPYTVPNRLLRTWARSRTIAVGLAIEEPRSVSGAGR